MCAYVYVYIDIYTHIYIIHTHIYIHIYVDLHQQVENFLFLTRGQQILLVNSQTVIILSLMDQMSLSQVLNSTITVQKYPETIQK